MWKKFIDWLDTALDHFINGDMTTDTPAIPAVEPVTPPKIASSAKQTPDPIDSLLPWENVVGSQNNRHNVRAICDLEGLTYDQKETLTACVRVESDFYPLAIHKNFAVNSEGVRYLASTDHGICQWNDAYHGKEITPEQATNDPEMAVRLMCKYFKNGQQGQWVSFSSGAYLQYKGKV